MRIHITIEDALNRSVRIFMSPSIEKMAQSRAVGEKPTPAHDYAMLLLQSMKEHSQVSDGSHTWSRLDLPKGDEGASS